MPTIEIHLGGELFPADVAAETALQYVNNGFVGATSETRHYLTRLAHQSAGATRCTLPHGLWNDAKDESLRVCMHFEAGARQKTLTQYIRGHAWAVEATVAFSSQTEFGS